MFSIESPKKVTQKERKSSLTESNARRSNNEKSPIIGFTAFFFSVVVVVVRFNVRLLPQRRFLVQCFWERVVMFLRRPFSQSDSRCRSCCSNCWRITNLNFKFINLSEGKKRVNVVNEERCVCWSASACTNHKDIEKRRQPIHKNNIYENEQNEQQQNINNRLVVCTANQKPHTQMRPWYSGSKERKATLPDWKLNQQNNSLKIWVGQTKWKMCDEMWFCSPSTTQVCVGVFFPKHPIGILVKTDRSNERNSYGAKKPLHRCRDWCVNIYYLPE